MARYKGYIMVVIAACLWGVSGTVAQRLFEEDGISMRWLVTIRLIISGILFIIYGLLNKNLRQDVFEIWRHRSFIGQFVIFGTAGMLGVQYTYFAAIDEGNAAVATLLQYLAPVFIMFYYILKTKVKPTIYEYLSVTMALSGTYLLLTNGSFDSLAIPLKGLTWGILSALALAFYTIYSDHLIRQFHSVLVVGWGMLIGGISISFIQSPFAVNFSGWANLTWVFVGFVILFGTLIPFFLFIDSLRYISAKESSLLSCSEPLASVLTSVLWLHVPFGFIQGLGTILIISMVILLTVSPEKIEENLEKSVHGETG
ncbi:DMT family transporter [Peribacillus tepidiphilus]|uniref:DMT family transporter n=1 Tax=Peribacillus tepidiphilus TaxID=2652445 RepID=UPI0035B55271